MLACSVKDRIMNHLLIDFENLQPANLGRLSDENTCIWLFLGLHQQKTIELELCESLCRFGKNVRFIRLEKSGKNALDFYISFYLGRIIESDPAATIAILSRDSGYDTLVEHIRNQYPTATIGRFSCIGEVESAPSMPLPEKQSISKEHSPQHNSQPPAASRLTLEPYYRAALTALRRPDAYRPSRLANLQGNLQKYLLHTLISDKSIEEQRFIVHAIITKLKNQRLIEIDSAHDIVTYFFSDADTENLLYRYILKTSPKTPNALPAAFRHKAERLGVETNDTLIVRLITRLQAEQVLCIAADGNISYPSVPNTQPAKQPESASMAATTSVLPLLGAKERQQINERLHKLIALPNHPKKLATLQSSIRTLLKPFQAAFSFDIETETQGLVQYLVSQKAISFNNQTVVYKRKH